MRLLITFSAMLILFKIQASSFPHTTKWRFQFDSDTTFHSSLNVVFLSSSKSDELIKQYNDHGIVTVGYISIGSDEPLREDSKLLRPYRFEKMKGWDEYWLDLDQQDKYISVMKARLDSIKQRGIQGVYFDNPDIASNTDQDEQLNIKYVKTLATYSHDIGLYVGLNNGLKMLPNISSEFDFFINEECYRYNECHYYNEVVEQQKPIFGIEYKKRSCRPVEGHSRKLMNLKLNRIKKDC